MNTGIGNRIKKLGNELDCAIFFTKNAGLQVTLDTSGHLLAYFSSQIVSATEFVPVDGAGFNIIILTLLKPNRLLFSSLVI